MLLVTSCKTETCWCQLFCISTRFCTETCPPNFLSRNLTYREETDEEDGKLRNKEQQKDKETEDDNDEEEESDEQDNDDDVDKGINTEIFIVQILVLRSKMTKSLVCYENVDPEPSQVWRS